MSNIQVLQYHCIYLSTCNQAKKQIKIKILEVLRASDLIFNAFFLLLFLFIQEVLTCFGSAKLSS